MPPTEASKCYLLSMCAELRVRIYCHLFKRATVFLKHTYDDDSHELIVTRLWSIDCPMGILSACKTTHIESKPVLAESVFLTISLHGWNPTAAFRVFYPSELDDYLLSIRNVRIETNCSRSEIEIDLERLPNLKQLTYAEVDDVALLVKTSFTDESKALELITDESDPKMVKWQIDAELEDMQPQPRPNLAGLLWLQELQADPKRLYQLVRENEYEIRIMNKDKGMEVGNMVRYIKLRFDACSYVLIETVSSTFWVSGRWKEQTIQLCAASNRAAGLTDPQREIRDSGEWEWPL